MCVCVCVVIMLISEVNDNNDTKDRRKEFGLFCYYKILSLPMKGYSII